MSKKNLFQKLLSALPKLSPQMIVVCLVICEIVLLIPLLSLLNKKERSHKVKEPGTSTNSFTQTSSGQSSKLFSEDRTLVKQRLPIIPTNPGSNGAFITALPALPPDITAQKRENLPPIPLPVPSPSRLPLPPAPTATSIPPAKNNPTKQNPISPTQKKTTPVSAIPNIKSANVRKDATNSPQKPQKTTSKPISSKTSQPKVSSSPTPTSTPTSTPTPNLNPNLNPSPNTSPNTSPKRVEEQLLDDVFAKLNTEVELIEDLNFSQPEKFAASISGLKKTIGTVVGKNPQELALILKNNWKPKVLNYHKLIHMLMGLFMKSKKLNPPNI